MKEIYRREINRLTHLLQNAGVPYEVSVLWDGYKIDYPSADLSISDVVCHEYSYGNEWGLLEQMGLTNERMMMWKAISPQTKYFNVGLNIGSKIIQHCAPNKGTRILSV